MFVTDTLGNPFPEVEELGSLYRTISESRRGGPRGMHSAFSNRFARNSASFSQSEKEVQA
jgi:hypothetical protein